MEMGKLPYLAAVAGMMFVRNVWAASVNVEDFGEFVRNMRSETDEQLTADLAAATGTYNITADNLRISGNNHYLDAQNGYLKFNIFDSSAVSWHDITLENISENRETGMFDVRNATVTFNNFALNNVVQTSDKQLHGILNFMDGAVVEIIGSWFENIDILTSVMHSDNSAAGGVLYVQRGLSGLSAGQIAKIESSTFMNNRLTSNGDIPILGGVIYNEGSIGAIDNSLFMFNTISTTAEGQSAYGAAIANGGFDTQETDNITIGGIHGTVFANNSAAAYQGSAYGGAVYNEGIIGDLKNVTFGENSAVGRNEALGGAMYVASGELSFSGVNTFFGNSAAASEGTALGGAIYMQSGTVNFAGENYFSANQANGSANDIYVADGKGRVVVKSGGKLYLDGGIDGGGVTEVEEGGEIIVRHVLENTVLGNTVLNRGLITVDSNYSLVLSKAAFNSGLINAGADSKIRAAGMYNEGTINNGGTFVNEGNMELRGSGKLNNTGTVQIGGDLISGSQSELYMGSSASLSAENYKAARGSTLRLDIAVDGAANRLRHGVLNIDGDVSGYTRVILNFLTGDDSLTDAENVLSPYVIAPNDNPDTAAEFLVSRIFGSPLMYNWASIRNALGTEDGSVWYLHVGAQYPELPFEDLFNVPMPPDQPVYAPEIAAYVGLPSLLMEQNRDLLENMASETAYPCAEKRGCRRAWLRNVYRGIRADAPQEYKGHADNLLFGSDIFADSRTRGGIFGSYGQGRGKFSGRGRYYSAGSTKADVKSWLGGLYFNHTFGRWQLMSVLFGGRQRINLTTGDTVINAETHADQYGAGAMLRRSYRPAPKWTLQPSVSVLYETFKIDSVEDNAGKTARYSQVDFTEVGLALEIAYAPFGQGSRLFVRPAAVQTFGGSAATAVTGLDRIKALKNQTLGKLEIGGELHLGSKWSVTAAAGCALGNDYRAYNLNANLRFAF